MARNWTKVGTLAVGCLLVMSAFAADAPNQFANDNAVVFDNKMPQGLVGNGKSIVMVRPFGFEYHVGGTARGTLQLSVDGQPRPLTMHHAQSRYFPGGVIYRQVMPDMTVEFLHGALPDVPYLVAVRVSHLKNPNAQVSLEISETGAPKLTPTGVQKITAVNGQGELVLASGAAVPQKSWDELYAQMTAPYKNSGMVLDTPDKSLNRAVALNRYLLDLGFDGKLHVCELFRWKDVWSRDLGTGLAPGAMASGQYADARTTIEYDLRRYANHIPAGLRVTEDPSQGGSAEGTAWLTRAVWRDYLQSGDKTFLINAEKTLKPWVEAWIARDSDERGLLVDTTEWMDHSRFFLFPDGARVLYSNALMVDLLGHFNKIETTLGNTAAAQRYAQIRTRFMGGINAGLWDEKLGMYDNLSMNGVRDERLSSDGNVLAILAGVPTEARTKTILQTIKSTGWREAGSTTITPPMTHVPANNDHNFKVWPWWNAVEARARFRHGDVEGAMHLLERSAKTVEDEHDPGMIEELTTPEGVTDGGHAFLSAAGSYLDAVWEGLLGIDIADAGSKKIRIEPHTPKDWKNWSANAPLAQGELQFRSVDGALTITNTDPRVQVIEVPKNVKVIGAQTAELSPQKLSADTLATAPTPKAMPAIKARKAVVFYEDGISENPTAGLPAERVNAEQLLTLSAKTTPALIIAGNALPTKTQGGGDVKAALAKYLDEGGAVVFYGATMHERGGMGEHGGVIDWYEPVKSNDKGKEKNQWQGIDPYNGKPATHPIRHGVNSWGPSDYFFKSWETSRGAFGFFIFGKGVQFAGALAGEPSMDIDTHEAFTDFAVTAPWQMEALAYTHTDKHILIPDKGETYPAAVRIANHKTGGEFIILPASLTRTEVGLGLLHKLGIK